jgi:hypothetical protein
MAIKVMEEVEKMVMKDSFQGARDFLSTHPAKLFLSKSKIDQCLKEINKS